jgi:hypothetical protein
MSEQAVEYSKKYGDEINLEFSVNVCHWCLIRVHLL